MASLIQTTTPLGSNGVFTSDVLYFDRGTRIVGSAFSDQTGTIHIRQSGDGTNWDVDTSYAIAAGDGSGFEEALVLPYVEIRYVNGSVAQTAFRLFTDVRDSVGAPIAPQPPYVEGDFFVLQYDPSAPSSWVAVGRFDAVDATDANGLAAISIQTNGKYAAWAISDATVDQVTLQQIADETAVDFDS